MTITKETIQVTRQWFVDNALACITEVEQGNVKVNNQERYIQICRKRHYDALAGKFDCSLAFIQRAHFIQTGKSVALLP